MFASSSLSVTIVPLPLMLYRKKPMGQERRQGVMVRFSDGSSFLVRLPNEEACIDVLEELKAVYPYMMMGYNPELEAVFAKNPKELWSAAGYQNVKE